MKTCSKCLVNKPLDAFYQRLQSKDGRRGQCMACMDNYCRSRAEYLHASRSEVVANKSEKTCTSCKIPKALNEFGKWKASTDGHRTICKLCFSEKRKKNYCANRELENQRSRAYYANNKDLFRRHKSAYIKKNQDSIREYNANWVANNLARVGAKNARRYAEKLQATPKWANPGKIQKFYEEARRMTLESGVPHEVDHIVPLKGPIAKSGPFKGVRLVCGLHWEGNLQVIKMVDNVAKKNYFWPDMPLEYVSEHHREKVRSYAATAHEPTSKPEMYLFSTSNPNSVVLLTDATK